MAEEPAGQVGGGPGTDSPGEPSTYDPATSIYNDDFAFQEVTGTSLSVGDTAPQEVKGIHFMLRFDPTTQQFVVMSSYPNPART